MPRRRRCPPRKVPWDRPPSATFTEYPVACVFSKHLTLLAYERRSLDVAKRIGFNWNEPRSAGTPTTLRRGPEARTAPPAEHGGERAWGQSQRTSRLKLSQPPDLLNGRECLCSGMGRLTLRQNLILPYTTYMNLCSSMPQIEQECLQRRQADLPGTLECSCLPCEGHHRGARACRLK